MSDHTYRVVEIVGTSPEGIDTAIRNGVSRAAKTLRDSTGSRCSRFVAISRTARSLTSR